MTSALPLQIQRLGGFPDQTLVLAHVAELRSPNASTSPKAIEDVFLKLRIPPPSNVSQYLFILSKRGLVVKVRTGRWALTPEGKERIRRLMASASEEDLRRVVATSRDAVLGDAPHHLLPPELAPAKFHEGIARFLDGYPFDRNVLCISRFPRDSSDPVGAAIDTCRSACAEFSLDLHLASDRSVEELLFGNVAAAMWACHYGIAIFEDRVGEGLNTNVSLEVGAMLVTGRRCLLLRDTTVESMPTDLIGHIYQPVDLTDLSDLEVAVERWVEQDLGLAA